MKNEEENKHSEEWLTPSIDAIDISKDTKLGDLPPGDDGVFFS
jgi:hypothetical protein